MLICFGEMDAAAMMALNHCEMAGICDNAADALRHTENCLFFEKVKKLLILPGETAGVCIRRRAVFFESEKFFETLFPNVRRMGALFFSMIVA